MHACSIDSTHNSHLPGIQLNRRSVSDGVLAAAGTAACGAGAATAGPAAGLAPGLGLATALAPAAVFTTLFQSGMRWPFGTGRVSSWTYGFSCKSVGVGVGEGGGG